MDQNGAAPGGKKKGMAKAIGLVMLITVFSKLFGVLRESVQANVLGTADEFYVGYNKTIYLFITVAYAMCVAAVPIITRAFASSKKEGERVSGNLITLSSVIGLGLLAVLELSTFIPGLNALWNADSETMWYIRVMALTLPVIIAAYQLVATLQALDHYAMQGYMILPYSIVLVAYLLVLGRKMPVRVYAILMTVFWTTQLAMGLPGLIKEKFHFRPSLQVRNHYTGIFLKTSLVTIVTSSTYLFCYLLDADFARPLGEGAATAFYYADKMFAPVISTFIYSITAVLFPNLSREATTDDKDGYLSHVWEVTSNTMIVMLPLSTILLVFGHPIIKFLFEGGNFTAESTEAAVKVFTMYAAGAVGFCALDLLNKAFFTMDRPLLPLLISVGVIVVNAALNFLFGVSGMMLAMTTSISMTVGAVVTVLLLFRGRLRCVRLGDFLKTVLSSAVMGGTAYGLYRLLVSADEGKILLLVKCLGIGVVAGALFLACCWVLKVEALTDAIRKKLAERKEKGNE